MNDDITKPLKPIEGMHTYVVVGHVEGAKADEIICVSRAVMALSESQARNTFLLLSKQTFGSIYVEIEHVYGPYSEAR
jgi:hypothetical protein